MLYHRVPYPPNKGEKMRAYQQLRYIAGRHRVWLACFLDAEEDQHHLPRLEAMCHRFEAVPLNKHLALSKGGMNVLRGRTLTEGYYGHSGMWQVVQSWVDGHFFDVAFAFSSSMGVYIEELPVGRRVLDMNDFDSRKWADYATKSTWPLASLFRTEASRLALRERELISKCDMTLMVNDRECRQLGDPALAGRVRTFHTPIDVDSYERVWGVTREKVVSYVGTMNYRPNIEAVTWFADRVWPQVIERHPDAVWRIVGRRPTREVMRLSTRRGIDVVGEVDEVRDYLAATRVFVAPVQTDIGIQTKVLESLAAGRPTVITESGHLGIGAEPDRDYLVARDVSGFVNAVDRLLSDHAACCALGDSAVQFVKAHFAVPVLMPQFEALLTQAQPVQATP